MVLHVSPVSVYYQQEMQRRTGPTFEVLGYSAWATLGGNGSANKGPQMDVDMIQNTTYERRNNENK